MHEEDKDVVQPPMDDSGLEANTRAAKAWYRNPRLVIGVIFGFLLVISQGVEQWNSDYATPPLLTELAKIVIPTLILSGGLAEAARIVRGQNGNGEKERNVR